MIEKAEGDDGPLWDPSVHTRTPEEHLLAMNLHYGEFSRSALRDAAEVQPA